MNRGDELAVAGGPLPLPDAAAVSPDAIPLGLQSDIPTGPPQVLAPDPGPLPLVPVGALLNPAAAARSAAALRGAMMGRGGRARSRSPPEDPGAASSDPIYADPAPAYRGRRTIPASFRDYIPGNLVRFADGRGAFVLESGKLQFLPGKVKPEDIDRIPLYDKNDQAAKARYRAAARASKMS